MIKRILVIVLLLGATCQAAVTVQFQLSKQKPVEAGIAFNQKLHTISVLIETWAPGDDPNVATPFSSDIASSQYNNVGGTVTAQIAVTEALLLIELTEILLRRDLEYALWVHAKHDTMITNLTTSLALL